MIDTLSALLAAFGLSASAGLNAYIPMLIVALAGRYTTWFRLSEPYDALTNGWVILALLILLAIEFFADKVPAVNHANDAIQTFIRPAAGALLFAASTGVAGDVSPVVAVIAGLLIAGSVHTVKSAAVRPAVTATTGGIANPLVSVAEDLIATGLSILAVVVPALVAVALVLLAAFFLRWFLRRAGRRRSLTP